MDVGMTIGHHYYDPENERIVVFLGELNIGQELRFRDFETSEVFDLYEWEIREEWPHMNEMEVIAWASK